MGKKLPLRQPLEAAFPETRQSLLIQAAGGQWDAFLAAYLSPCWRELLMQCRRHGVNISDAEDLYQELCLRMVRPGKFRRSKGDTTASESLRTLPARHLQYQGSHDVAARFRTLLKQTILNILREALRAKARHPIKFDDQQWDWFEPTVEESLSALNDRVIRIQHLHQTAQMLREECIKARTQGRRRLFEILRRTVINGESAGYIAVQLALERATVSDLLSQARNRFLEIWKKLSGDTDGAELKSLIKSDPEALQAAFASIE